eukprot:1717984-Pleurochrysis_carterae.AAC.1
MGTAWLRARFAVHVGGLMQVREAGTAWIGRVAEFVHERADQCFHRPAHVHHACVRFYVMQ